jgi:hypothetical protein
MTKSPLRGLVIRTGCVRRPDLGYLIAGDPKKERQDIPHAYSFKWKAGDFTRGEAKFNAHTVCIVENPESGLLMASDPGLYSWESRRGLTAGNISRESKPEPSAPRFGSIRSVCAIAGTGYAVGFQGTVFRLDGPRVWTRLDEGLPRDFDIEAMDGFGPTEMYAVGFSGAVWQFDGRQWAPRHLPTNATLNAVKCGGDGTVYIGGKGGVLLRGRGDKWSLVELDVTDEDFWDLEWFEGTLYASTMLGVFRLDGDSSSEVDFGSDEPETTYHLSAATGVLWSIGDKDVMSFDGKTWTRVV